MGKKHVEKADQEKVLKEIAHEVSQKVGVIRINVKTQQRLMQLQSQVNVISKEINSILKTLLELYGASEKDQYSVSEDFSTLTLADDKKES